DYSSEVCLWDIAHKRRKKVMPLGELFCRKICFSPASDLLAVWGTLGIQGRGALRVFETADGGEMARLRLSAGRFSSHPTFSPDGKLIAINPDNTVMSWSIHRSR